MISTSENITQLSKVVQQPRCATADSTQSLLLAALVRALLLYTVSVMETSGIGELWTVRFQFVKRVRHADIQPHVGGLSEQVGFFHVDGGRGIAGVLLVDVIASGIGNQPDHISV